MIPQVCTDLTPCFYKAPDFPVQLTISASYFTLEKHISPKVDNHVRIGNSMIFYFQDYQN